MYKQYFINKYFYNILNINYNNNEMSIITFTKNKKNLTKYNII